MECELRGKRILITGAAGFIGSRLVKQLLDLDAEVFAILEKGSILTRIEPILANPRLHLIHCSLTDKNTLSVQRQKWGEIDLVAHLGLKPANGHNYYEQSMDEITMNLLPTMNLIGTLGESIRGICFASSTSIYGCPTHLPVSEKDLPAPISSYGATKLAIENYLSTYGRMNNVPVTILRYSTVYGPGEFGHRAIPNFLHSIANRQPIHIYGDGSEIRDYVYIDDVVRATILALAKRPELVLNIGSGQGYTVRQVAQKIISLCSTDVECRFVPNGRQSIDFTCDISAAREILSYNPQTNLEEGLKQEIEYYNEQTRTSLLKGKNQDTDVPKEYRWRWLRRLFSYSTCKDVTDRLLALLIIVVLSPLLVLIALGIMFGSRESPVFSQERVGKNGSRFVAYKFRTMYANGDDSKYREYIKKYVLENAPYRVDNNGNGVYKVDDSQITGIGAILRKTNLDELPQLVNVLRGEMSFIGPRPDIPYAVAMYKDWHRKRLDTKPGITGLWQVCGRKSLPFEEMVRLDIDYIKRQSLVLDTKILIKTIGTILKCDGS